MGGLRGSGIDITGGKDSVTVMPIDDGMALESENYEARLPDGTVVDDTIQTCRLLEGRSHHKCLLQFPSWVTSVAWGAAARLKDGQNGKLRATTLTLDADDADDKAEGRRQKARGRQVWLHLPPDSKTCRGRGRSTATVQKRKEEEANETVYVYVWVAPASALITSLDVPRSLVT
ncbi:hypothetical protein F503_07933 [Ophiostoma piceae UAMH 11346]|uniref:Uncharacterized protein n=1 Tax=Ophiostoma piceae (strain UAMH 11346) TaxID=1262450 RepID=S3C3D5_OPHP1|nr:hypothetical protein F503_07933 [Ophiostoma piceae UAMH 11346]